ncbi:MAG: alpha-amylase family protein [Timaviella obliquedivisa GSE-PSE-MK23-08B]|jgi:alpha-amylase|nr:alpha-amylase family protein [Timaviella obliquedivisa GSE-PSE-MK23-08B]
MINKPFFRIVIPAFLTLLVIITVHFLTPTLKAQTSPPIASPIALPIAPSIASAIAPPIALPIAPFVHLFEWKWNDVAQECETFLAPNGYGAVQVSPPNEHAVIAEANYPWWQRYQPISYRIKSRSGDRAEFAAMVARCHAVGVNVYADAVINHMAAISSGVGSAGTSFTRYNYPGSYEPKDFHTCRRGISNYGDHDEVTNCELVGLPDLDTGANRVREKISDYLTDLVNLGVDGFRIDAAKHIKTKDLAAILRRVYSNLRGVHSKPFIYQEVIDPGTEAVRKSEYYDNGQVTEFEYGKMVGEAFLGVEGQNLAQLEKLAESSRLMPSEKAIAFIDNHDKQRGHGGGGNYLTYKQGQIYNLANIFMLAYPYGIPQVMSSYNFTHSDQGPPSDSEGNTNSVYINGEANCFKEWTCEHRWGAIARMVSFHNLSANQSLTHWWSNGGNQIAFGRGNIGFVVINREAQPLTQTFQTGLSSGFYCNVVVANAIGCSPTEEVKVNRRGQITLTVEGMNAIAIHKGSKIPRR